VTTPPLKRFAFSGGVVTQVKEVLVNLTLPPVAGDTDEIAHWGNLAFGIGCLFRGIFPNFNANNSAMIVHFGFKRLRCDEAFLKSDTFKKRFLQRSAIKSVLKIMSFKI
jgi:hypothetical protein